MDAVIRFCFAINPEDLDLDEYAKIYGQAKWVYNDSNMVRTEKALNNL